MVTITEKDVEEILHPKLVLDSIQDVFKQYAKGLAAMPCKVYLEMNTPGDDYRAMPAYTKNVAGIKWIADYGSNAQRNKPTTDALIILNNKHTGQPLALIQANYITKARTAATTALATKAIIQEDEVVKMSFIGCGAQTLEHILYLQHTIPSLVISLFDLNLKKAFEMANKIRFPGVDITVERSLDECIKDSRIITTLTPARRAYLTYNMLPDEPVHINAVGADAVGKRELSDDINFNCSTLVYDDKEQATHSGESQYRIGPTFLNRNAHFEDYELKNVLNWSKETRKEKIKKNLTIYDSTGLAIEDMALAEVVWTSIK